MPRAMYTVQSTDTTEGLLGIAQRFYGDPQRWTIIYEANRGVIGHNPDVIRAGQQLVIPDINGKHGRGATARVYVVQLADVYEGLRGIAQQVYGDAGRWQALYDVNKGVIGSDPRYLQAGQCLVIP